MFRHIVIDSRVTIYEVLHVKYCNFLVDYHPYEVFAHSLNATSRASVLLDILMSKVCGKIQKFHVM